jgi:seryl-tRNA synthetase
MKTKSDEIKALDARLAEIETRLTEIMYIIPNLIDDSVPYGLDDADNVEVRHYLEPTEFSYKPAAHWEIGEKFGILNTEEAAKITGARFTVYHGLGARLERACINFMLDTHTAHGYEEVLPPFMVNRDSMLGTGQLPKFEFDMYAIKDSDYFLVPTAEVPVTNLRRNEIISADRLPIKYCAYTACFRGEAGSAGRDTRGLIRQHEFNKVELVKIRPSRKKFRRTRRPYGRSGEYTAGSENSVQSRLSLLRRRRIRFVQDLRYRSVDAVLRKIRRNIVVQQLRRFPGSQSQHKIPR